MPEKETVRRAQRARRQGKSPSTQAGEFVREEMHHIRRGKHGARSTKQAIAIGLSKARRSGVKLTPPRPGQASSRTRKSAERDYKKGQSGSRATPSSRRSRAAKGALARERKSSASRASLSQHARAAARRRSAADRRAAARKAARTKGPAVRRRAAQKAARTRKRNAA